MPFVDRCRLLRIVSRFHCRDLTLLSRLGTVETWHYRDTTASRESPIGVRDSRPNTPRLLRCDGRVTPSRLVRPQKTKKTSLRFSIKGVKNCKRGNERERRRSSDTAVDPFARHGNTTPSCSCCFYSTTTTGAIGGESGSSILRYRRDISAVYRFL